MKASFRICPGISTVHGGGNLHSMLTSHTDVVLVQHIVVRCIGYTRTHNSVSVEAAKRHQAHLHGAEDVVHTYNWCSHHGQYRHHTVDIGNSGKCSCKWGHEKRYSQMEKPSQPALEQVAPQVQCPHCTLVRTGYRRRRQEETSLFEASVEYSSG